MEAYRAGTFSVFGRAYTLRPLPDPTQPNPEVNEDLEKAKTLITAFCAEEYNSEPDFSDLRKVDIAYTTITDEEVPVQVSVDLVDFRLDRSIDGIIVDSRKYDTLKELTEQELVDPDFDELVAFSEEQLAKVALHGIRDKVVQRFTESGEEIQMQGTLTYKVGLGTDVFGNIQRMDNLLESMPTRQLDYKEKLKNLEIQVEIAKQEVEKPFPREEELKAKSARLDQLNILLNMDKRENEIVDGVQDEGEIQPQRESRGWDR